MADCFTAVTARPVRRCMLLLLMAACLAALAGCGSVQMPQLPKLDFNLLQDKPAVAIKAGYGKVNIRPTPSTTQPPIATLKGGDKLELLEESGSWLNVSFYDTTGVKRQGWVYKYLVEGFDKPPEPVATAPGPSDAGLQGGSAPAAEPLEVESSPKTQSLPKSGSVSPM